MAEVTKTWPGEVALRLLACAKQRLEDAGRDVAMSHLVYGLTVADDTYLTASGKCAGGLLYVRIPQMYPSGTPWHQPNSSPSNCAAPMLGMQLAVGVFRCAPTQGTNGKPPSDEKQTQAALEMLLDAELIKQAIECCMRGTKGVDNRLLLGTWTPSPASGGAYSSEWTLTVGVPNCVDCTEPEPEPEPDPEEGEDG